MSASSSSSDEDLSMFQSVAVTADDIAESARKEAESVARRRTSSAGRGPGQPSIATAAGPGKVDGDSDDANGEQLDLTSLKIAAALEAMLARHLDDSTAAATAAGTAASQAVTHAPAAATAAPEPNTANKAAAGQAADGEDDTTGVRLFKRVTPGTACVITNNEYGTAAAGADPLQLHLHPGAQKHVRIRDLIPRLSLAEASSKRKRQHQHVLAALAVEGAALLAAAATTDSAWRDQQYQQQQQQEQQGKKAKITPTGATSGVAGTLAAWQAMKKRKVQGVVVDAKPFVPQDVRMAKLLGQPLPP